MIRDGLIRKDFRETLGQAKPKAIDDLMSLENEWADGEDSTQNPRHHHRSPDEGDDTKDQHYSGTHRVRKRGRRNRYTDAHPTDMVAAGYTNNQDEDNHDGPRQGNTYYGSSNRSAYHDNMPKTEWRKCRDQPPPSMDEFLNGGCYKHTYLNKDGKQKPTHLLIECREFILLR
jgi:hypothetical protein